MTNGIAYKVVRRLKDGTLVSVFVDNTERYPKDAKQLTYAYGKITTQGPNSEAGIFCHRTLEHAIMSDDVSDAVPCTVEVREVFSSFDEIPFWHGKTLKRMVNYPAVLVGRKVSDIER